MLSVASLCVVCRLLFLSLICVVLCFVACYLLFVVRCLLLGVCCLLFVVCCLLFAVFKFDLRCLLVVVRCSRGCCLLCSCLLGAGGVFPRLMFVVRCLRSVVCCVLFVVRCLLSFA